MRQRNVSQSRDLENVLGLRSPSAAGAGPSVEPVTTPTPLTSRVPPAVPTSRALSLELAPTLRSAGIARRAVAAALAGDTSGSAALDTVVLLTDELVTNAVVHAGSACRLEVAVSDAVVTVSVIDTSRVIPSPRGELALDGDDVAGGNDLDLARLAEGGRGLRLVELLATAWGVEPLSAGKRVWFSASLLVDDD